MMRAAAADSPTCASTQCRVMSECAACWVYIACCLLLQVVRSHKSMVAKAAASAKKTDERSTDKAGEGDRKHAKNAGSGEKKRKASREEQPAERTKPAKPAVSKPQKKQKTPVGAAQLVASSPGACTGSALTHGRTAPLGVTPTSCFCTFQQRNYGIHLSCRDQDDVLGYAEEAREDEIHLRHGWH